MVRSSFIQEKKRRRAAEKTLVRLVQCVNHLLLFATGGRVQIPAGRQHILRPRIGVVGPGQEQEQDGDADDEMSLTSSSSSSEGDSPPSSDDEMTQFDVEVARFAPQQGEVSLAANFPVMDPKESGASAKVDSGSGEEEGEAEEVVLEFWEYEEKGEVYFSVME